MTAFRVHVRVASESLSPDEITTRLGVSADESVAKGSGRQGSIIRDDSIWIRKASTQKKMARLEDFEQEIIAWGMPFATALGELVETEDCVVFLEIVQEINDLDDNLQKGIFLSRELIAWMAVAKISLDIDQYIYHDCNSGDDTL